MCNLLVPYLSLPASQKRRPKAAKGDQHQPNFYNDFEMPNQQQQQFIPSFGQQDMFYGGQGKLIHDYLYNHYQPQDY